MPRRSFRFAVVTGIAVAAGILVPLDLAAVAPANAYWDCETAPPYTEYDGTSVEFVYSAAGAAGDTLEIFVPEMCVSATATVTELSNADGLTVTLLADGSNGSTITLAPPTPRRGSFSGLSRSHRRRSVVRSRALRLLRCRADHLLHSTGPPRKRLPSACPHSFPSTAPCRAPARP